MKQNIQFQVAFLSACDFVFDGTSPPVMSCPSLPVISCHAVIMCSFVRKLLVFLCREVAFASVSVRGISGWNWIS